MNKKIMLVALIGIVLISGCTSSPRTDRKNFYFNDTNSSIENEKICFELCKAREVECGTYILLGYPTACDCKFITSTTFNCCCPTRYHCDYDPVICDDGVCICKTW